jgi:peptidyl-prolyl cis-trans isomerase C
VTSLEQMLGRWAARRLRARVRVIIISSLLAVGTSSVSVAVAQDTDVVARVNGSDITAAELAVASEMFADQLGDMPEDAKRSLLVDTLIDLRLFEAAGRSAGLAETEAYKLQIAFFERQTLRAFYLDAEVAKLVTEAAVRQAYDAHIAGLQPVEELRLRHILVADEASAGDVIAALQSGADFAELAKARSIDESSKTAGGDLGFVAAGQTIPELEAAAAALKVGEFSQTAVRTAFGFHVIKLEERRQRPAPSFESLDPQIRAALEAAAGKQVLAKLRAGASIEKLVPDVSPPDAEADHDH